MDTTAITKAIAENKLDDARSLVHQALSEKAVEALQARKQEIGATYFQPKNEE